MRGIKIPQKARGAYTRGGGGGGGAYLRDTTVHILGECTAL